MNALATTNNNTALAVDDDFDPFAAYASAQGGTRIVGQLLKFSKGDYLVGQNGDIMQEGSKLAVNMNELLVGWIKWENKKPVEQLMSKLVDMAKRKEKPQKRGELGDLDQALWETDKDGKPQDPWQFTNYLLMKVPGLDDQDALFTFTASSRGGVNAITALCDSYSVLGRMRPRGPNGEKQMPIVALGVERYNHKEYGWLKNPQFKIVGWVDHTEFATAMEQEAKQAVADAEARTLDKDIPF